MIKKHTVPNIDVKALSEVLSHADDVYSKFRTGCAQLAGDTQTPTDIQEHLMPVMKVAGAFTQLSDMLTTGNRKKDVQIRAGIGTLLAMRKEAYRQEAHTLMQSISSADVPEHIKLAHNLTSPQETLFNLDRHLGTASIAAHMDSLKLLAQSYHVQTTPGKLETTLKATDRTAEGMEKQFSLPEGSIRAILELDKSSFFNSLAKTSPDTIPNPAELLDKTLFTERLTQRIDDDTGIVFSSTIKTALSRVTGSRGKGGH